MPVPSHLLPRVRHLLPPVPPAMDPSPVRGPVMLPNGERGGGWEAGRPPGAQCGIKELIHAEPLRRCPACRCNNDGNNSHLNSTHHVPHTLGGCAHRGWFTPKNNPTRWGQGYRSLTGDETQGRDQAPCPESHSWGARAPGFEPRQLAP